MLTQGTQTHPGIVEKPASSMDAGWPGSPITQNPLDNMFSFRFFSRMLCENAFPASK
jgi:hypothetical protein